METWRLIRTGSHDGTTNMAVDEALLSCFDPHLSRPLFRVYGWAPPAISLGRFQQAEDVVDLERCAAAGIRVVRRITGGGAIYHAEELTYAIVCGARHLPAASVKESFRVLTRFLLRFYDRLALPASHAVDFFPAGTRLGERTSFCFAGKESYDIMVSGKKIGGNAQRRLKNLIFQHGSIPLVNHAAEGASFMRVPPPGVESAGAVADFGVRRAPEELEELLVDSFAATFPATLAGDNLTRAERDAAAVFAAARRKDPL